jgi:lysophospholipase L1-like esterase
MHSKGESLLTLSSNLNRLALAILLLAAVVGACAQTQPSKPHRAAQHAKAKPHSRSSGKARPAHKPHGKPPIASYRTGHGDRGIGTLVVPHVYKKPLPSDVAPPVPVPPGESGAKAIEYPAQLDKFFAQLQILEAADSADKPDTLRILQFGDSHTAADMFTGRMRSLFQARFGNGGAGFSYAGHPFAGYRILGTSRGQTSGWRDEGVHFTQIVDTSLGLGGVAATADSPGQAITLEAPCTTIELEYLDQPGGGAFSLYEDGAAIASVSTNHDLAPEILSHSCDSAEPSPVAEPRIIHHFEVRTESSGSVRLFGFVTTQPGITYEAIGLNGAELSLLERWKQPIFTSYLRQANPALIVLAYGTNEAANRNWTYDAYRALLGRVVDQLHATAPEASIIVIGPPDRSLRSGTRRHIAWRASMDTLHITEAQRDACREHGCAFWSWRDRMGGLGSMNRWVYDGLAQPDHTHFTSAGYVQLADLFYSDMMAAYAAWKADHPVPTLPPASPH